MLQPQIQEKQHDVKSSPRATVDWKTTDAANVRATLSPGAVRYFDTVVSSNRWKKKMAAYREHTAQFLSQVVPPNKSVLLIGCLTAEILESLKPSVGVGLDVSEKAVREARANSQNSNIKYHCALPENFKTTTKFDYVILLNVVDHSEDVLALVDSVRKFVHEDSRVILSMLNPLWHPLVKFASRLKIRIPDYKRNLVGSRILATALEVKSFKVMDTCRRVLIPKRIPLVSWVCNQFLSRLPGLNAMCFLQYVTAKPAELKRAAHSSCTVIVPCYNEEGNIAECIRRVPEMGSFTEILVVNDGSKDRTVEVVRSMLSTYPNLTLITYEKNQGKGNAVLKGLQAAKGDYVMILDADMTVPPEELTDFYDSLESKTADFASGTRFLYPMEREAMRLANYFGNIVFSKLVEIIVGSKCSDTLCGTKAMRKVDFADFKLEDSAWGDFDFIFHAARRKLKCVEVPVHYKSRVAGESKMKAFSSGISFLKLCFRKWSELP